MDIVNGFISFLADIPKIINDLKDTVINFFEIFNSVVNMIPQPFRQILLTFSFVLIGILIYKIFRG